MILFVFGCGKDSPPTKPDGVSGKLIMFHAGSLSTPIRILIKEFNRRYPDVTVLPEAAGTRTCARKISSLNRRCDVFAGADYRVVENLLVPEFAEFNIRFATNEICLAYTDKSRLAEKITAENWHEIVLRKDIAFGRSEPNCDPCGYRTVMVFQLAGKYYKLPNLAQRLEKKHAGRYIRPKETDLLALLELGQIDYLFIYRSVARQHSLRMILFPDKINLKSPALAELYGTATVKVTGKQPGQFITLRGEPIVYSITIPTTAVNQPAAEAFLEFVLSPQGQAIVSTNGQGVISPAIGDARGGFEKIPPRIRVLCKPGADL